MAYCLEIKKKQIIDKWNINKSQKHYAKREELDINEDILYDFIILSSRTGKLIYSDRNQKSGYLCMGGIV